jgi:hypothetical protein
MSYLFLGSAGQQAPQLPGCFPDEFRGRRDHFWIQKYISLFTAGEIKTKVQGLVGVCKCGWRGLAGCGGFGGYSCKKYQGIAFCDTLI